MDSAEILSSVTHDPRVVVRERDEGLLVALESLRKAEGRAPRHAPAEGVVGDIDGVSHAVHGLGLSTDVAKSVPLLDHLHTLGAGTDNLAATVVLEGVLGAVGPLAPEDLPDLVTDELRPLPCPVVVTDEVAGQIEGVRESPSVVRLLAGEETCRVVEEAVFCRCVEMVGCSAERVGFRARLVPEQDDDLDLGTIGQ